MKIDILAIGAHPDDVELELWSNHCQRNFFREKSRYYRFNTEVN